jgi:hypothetical protein
MLRKVDDVINDWPERLPRQRVRLVARVEREHGPAQEAELTDLSLEGCCLTGWFLIGERVTVDFPPVGKLRGQVRWAVLGRAGVRFERSG